MTTQASHGCGSAAGSGVVGGPERIGGAEADRCSLLSNGQLEVLRLVNRHLSSKEIGARLGISNHTVDQRVRAAMQRLQVSRRSEAARLVDAYDRLLGLAPEQETDTSPGYQRLIHQAPHIDAASDQSQTDGAVSFQIRHADRTGGDGAERLETEQRTGPHRPLLFLPVSTPHQPSNGWSVGRRLAAIVGVAITASFSAGMLLAGLESLARLVQS